MMDRYRWLGVGHSVWPWRTKGPSIGSRVPSPSGAGETVLPFFNPSDILNSGAAFSFLANAGGWQRYVFIALALVVSVGLTIILLKGVANRWEGWGYSLLRGAVGNLVDRLVRERSWIIWTSMPAAGTGQPSISLDTALCLSALILLLGTLPSSSSKQGAHLASAQEISMQILAINQNQEHKLAQRSFSLFDRRTLSALMLMGLVHCASAAEEPLPPDQAFRLKESL